MIELTLETLSQVDGGRVAAAFAVAMRRAVLDCKDRPGEKKPRKVTIEAELVPEVLQDGDVVDCQISFTIKTTTPRWQTATRPYQMQHSGQLGFNPDAPDSPRQSTMFAGEDAEDES